VSKRKWAEDKRICVDATPGPWKLVYTSDYDVGAIVSDGDSICDFGECPDPHDQVCGTAPNRNDARFITAAREGWPAALAEIKRLESELQRVSAYQQDQYESPLCAYDECKRIAREAINDASVAILVDAERFPNRYVPIRREGRSAQTRER